MDEMSARKEKPKSEEPSHPFFPEAKLSREAGEQSLMLSPPALPLGPPRARSFIRLVPEAYEHRIHGVLGRAEGVSETKA